MIGDLVRRLGCWLVRHRAVAYGPDLWLVVGTGQWMPAQRAICTRCRWRGYRTTWGALIDRGTAVSAGDREWSHN